MKMSNKKVLVEEYLEELFPDPKCELNYKKDYELLLAIMLSAQTTDKRVNECTKVLFQEYPTLEELSKADRMDIEKIIRPLGSFRKKSEYINKISTTLVENYESKVPVDREILEALPGVGRKTVNVFFSEFYNMPALAVDTHVERVSKRLKIAKMDASVSEVEQKLMRFYNKKDWARRHLQMVLFGRYHCKAMKPLCEECKLKIFVEKNKIEKFPYFIFLF